MSFADLGRRYLSVIAAQFGGQDLVLGGYSFGGNAAFAMAHQLMRETGRAPNLVLSESHPPHAYGSSPVPQDRLLETFALVVHSVQAKSRGQVVSDDKVAAQYRDIPLDAAIAKLMQSGLVPIGLGEKDLERFYRVWTVNRAILRGAVHHGPLAVNALLFNASEPECPLILQNLHIAASDHASRGR